MGIDQRFRSINADLFDGVGGLFDGVTPERVNQLVLLLEQWVRDGIVPEGWGRRSGDPVPAGGMFAGDSGQAGTGIQANGSTLAGAINEPPAAVVIAKNQTVTPWEGADRAGAKVASDYGAGDNGDSGVSGNSAFRKPSGWTRKELIDEAKEYTSFSATGFDRIRKAAQIKPGARGGKGQQRRFGKGELRKLIDAVVSSRVRTRKKIAEAWRGLLAV